MIKQENIDCKDLLKFSLFLLLLLWFQFWPSLHIMQRFHQYDLMCDRVKFNHKTPFYILFIQTKKNEQNKTKQLFITVFNLPGGRWNSKLCQFHAAHASFIPIMLFYLSRE